MNKPHKHTALIKAWADGAQIQARYSYQDKRTNWINSNCPDWNNPSAEFRLKPAEQFFAFRTFLYICGDKHRIGVIEKNELHLLHKESFVAWIDPSWTEIKIPA